MFQQWYTDQVVLYLTASDYRLFIEPGLLLSCGLYVHTYAVLDEWEVVLSIFGDDNKESTRHNDECVQMTSASDQRYGRSTTMKPHDTSSLYDRVFHRAEMMGAPRGISPNVTAHIGAVR